MMSVAIQRLDEGIRAGLGAHFLALPARDRSNTPIMRIAQRFGMKVVANAGEADARLVLPLPSLASRAGEFVADACGRCDRALQALVTRKLRPRAPCS